jgi:hypothetical protein
MLLLNDKQSECTCQNSTKTKNQQTYLVVAFERAPELTNKARHQQLANLWQLGVDDGYECREHWRERQASGLGLHHASAEETASANEILIEELRDNIFYIRDVDPVDDTSDRLAERVPSQALVLGTRLVFCCLRL